MKLSFDNDAGPILNRFGRLGALYALALSIIASVVIIGQVLIQGHLRDQESDSQIVNVAGKQRMLSQKISKNVLLLSNNQAVTEREVILHDLSSSLHLWKISQDGLRFGNDSLGLPENSNEAIKNLFMAINEDFEKMYSSGETIVSRLNVNTSVSYDSLSPDIKMILAHEDKFLNGMEAIVKEFTDEAHGKVNSLSTIEYIILAISLLVITVEVFFIFRPTAIQVNTTVNKLIDAEKNALKLSKEISALYASLEKSYEQISIVNQPVDNPRLIAKSDRGGNVTFITDSFSELSGIKNINGTIRLGDLLQGLGKVDDWMDEVVETISEHHTWQGELSFLDRKRNTCWMDITITPIYNEHQEVEELLMLGTDITLRKAAEQNMNLKNRAEIEKTINQQKFRSVLILEGQEEERKRIAMDIHDGIGQMLTSLKYQIESIDLKDAERSAQKIEEIDNLIKQVIKEVRKVTFNLKPTVLGDYGLDAALKVFTKEISKLIDIELVYRSEFEIPRLPQKIENNIFRIIQEAINNAIKYSESEKIEVISRESGNDLVIEVVDEGKGFDILLVESRSTNIESGRGFFNMYERTEYVNGQLEIDSTPGKGTRVVLKVPVRVEVVAE